MLHLTGNFHRTSIYLMKEMELVWKSRSNGVMSRDLVHGRVSGSRSIWQDASQKGSFNRELYFKNKLCIINEKFTKFIEQFICALDKLLAFCNFSSKQRDTVAPFSNRSPSPAFTYSGMHDYFDETFLKAMDPGQGNFRTVVGNQ